MSVQSSHHTSSDPFGNNSPLYRSTICCGVIPVGMTVLCTKALSAAECSFWEWQSSVPKHYTAEWSVFGMTVLSTESLSAAGWFLLKWQSISINNQMADVEINNYLFAGGEETDGELSTGLGSRFG